MFKTGYIQTARDWNGWPAKVRTDGTVYQVQRSHAIPLEKVTYRGKDLNKLITAKSKGLEDVEVVSSISGDGPRDENYLIVQGWTEDMNALEASEARRANFK